MAADSVESILVALTKAFSPDPVYRQIDVMMSWTYMNLTGPLLSVAVALRTFTEMHAGTTGNSRWGEAIKDIVTYTVVIILYSLIANEVLTYVYALQHALGQQSGLDKLLDNMSSLLEQIHTTAKVESNKKEWWDMMGAAAELISTPILLVAWGVFFISLIILLALEIVSRVALAIALGLGEVYGLVAIPISAAGGGLKLMGGWALLVGGVLMWPFVEDYLSWMAGGIITNVLDTIVSNGSLNNVNTNRIEVYLAYTVLNIFLSAIIIASPLIAEKLVANRSALGALAMPMLGAAGLAAKEIGSRMVNTVTDRAREGMKLGGNAAAGVLGQGAQQLLDWRHHRAPALNEIMPSGPRAAASDINLAPGAAESYDAITQHSAPTANRSNPSPTTQGGPTLGEQLGIKPDLPPNTPNGQGN
ncbi:MAG: hypothetical protein AABY83_15290 [Pseudomonadota bacterium]